ncbi:MAG: extracellular solute-binding protein, partial [Deltaproteobacteria bacterium]|nr:extracellular solute-binding protein [Deltaproteobacteria bacterium]
MKRVILAAVCLVVLVVPMVVSGSEKKGNPKDYWARMEAEARREGKLVIAASYSEDIPGFKKKYPEIDVQFLPLRGGEGLAKIRAEQAAKAYTIDIDITASSLLRILGKQRFLQDIGYLPEVADPKARFLFDPLKEPGIVYDRGSASGVIFNTNLVPPGAEPKTWKELADPKWKGKLTVDDPGVPGIGNRWFALMHAMYGEEYLKKVLFDNDPDFFKRSDGAIKLTARGEYHMAICLGFQGVYRVLEATPNAPIKFYYPDEGAIVSLLGYGLLKNAPHPNAA